MLNRVKILVVGDIIGKGARNAFIRYLPILKEKYNYDIICINAENTTHGRGMNYKHYLAYNQLGINVMTMGNHVVDNKEIYDYIDKTTPIITVNSPKRLHDALGLLNDMFKKLGSIIYTTSDFGSKLKTEDLTPKKLGPSNGAINDFIDYSNIFLDESNKKADHIRNSLKEFRKDDK